MLELNDQFVISFSKNVHSLATEVGGYKNLICSRKDYLNYIVKSRQFKFKVGGDLEALDYYVS